MSEKLHIEKYFDKVTFTQTYIVYCKKTLQAVIIDPVLDFERNSAKISYDNINNYINFVKQNNLDVKYILETHIHADHFSGAYDLRNIFPNAKLGIGSHITWIQETFTKLFNLNNVKTDGSQFNMLLNDGDILQLGELEIKIMETPGHTPNCISFLIEDNIFVGDLMFQSDVGCGRCDFPNGSADKLYDSVQKVYSLDPNTTIYFGHDYPPNGRDVQFSCKVLEQKQKNIMIPQSISKEDFVKFRTQKDKTLQYPNLLLTCIQVNINSGKLPEPEENGKAYLKIPLTINNNLQN